MFLFCWLLGCDLKIVITKIADYSDEHGNVISSPSKFEAGLKVVFSGKNNRLVIHPGFKPSNLVVAFNCDNGFCEIGKNSYSGTIRVGQDCKVKLGDNVTSTSPGYISTAEGSSVTVGNDVMIASTVELRSDDGHPIFDVATRERINKPKDIVIEDHVWLGATAIVLGGSLIREGSVVGIGSIVKGKFPNNCVIAGSPARVVRKNVAWERPHLTLTKPYYKNSPEDIPLTDYWNMTVEDELAAEKPID